MAVWWVLLAAGVLLYGTPGLLQLRASRGKRVPGWGWRIDYSRLPLWAWLPFFAGMLLMVLSIGRLTSLDWRGGLLALGCVVGSWLVQLALVGAHNRRVDRVPEARIGT